jgi:HSP20 family protein
MSRSHRERDDIQMHLNRLFGRGLSLQASVADAARDVAPPPADALETAREYLIKIYCPDVTPSDVDVKLQDGVLTVQGARRQSGQRLKDGTMAAHIPGRFVRRFTLPFTVESANVHAELANGVLSIQLPKLATPHTPTIQVRVVQKSGS